MKSVIYLGLCMMSTLLVACGPDMGIDVGPDAATETNQQLPPPPSDDKTTPQGPWETGEDDKESGEEGSEENQNTGNALAISMTSLITNAETEGGQIRDAFDGEENTAFYFEDPFGIAQSYITFDLQGGEQAVSEIIVRSPDECRIQDMLVFYSNQDSSEGLTYNFGYDYYDEWQPLGRASNVGGATVYKHRDGTFEAKRIGLEFVSEDCDGNFFYNRHKVSDITVK